MKKSKKAGNKKILSLFLAITMAFSQFGIVTYATENNLSDNSVVSVDSNDTSGSVQGGDAQDSTGGDAQGDTDGDAQDNTGGDAQDNTGGDTQGSTDGDTQGSTDGDTQGSTEGDAQDSTEGDAQGNTDGDAQDNAEGSSPPLANNEEPPAENTDNLEEGTIIEEEIDEYHAKIIVNSWITIEKGQSLQYANETLTATWKVADGGKFTSVMIEGSSGEVVTLTEPKEFTFGGEQCSLTESGGTYTMDIVKPKTDLTITVHGESATPPQEITVNAQCNEWIIMDQEDGLTVEGSDATAVWTVKEGGALSTIRISNSTESITVLGTGDFEFGGQLCTLEQTGGIYTLQLHGLTEDTELQILGETKIPPVKVSVSANEWIDMDMSTDIKLEGNTVVATWSLMDGGTFDSVTITNEDGTLTLNQPGETQFLGKPCTLTLVNGIYTLRVNGLAKDTEIGILGFSAQKVNVNLAGNKWVDIDPEKGLSYENGTVVATWSVLEDAKLGSVIVSNEDGTVTVTETGTFDFLGQSCSLEQVDNTYTMRLNGLKKDTAVQVFGIPKVPTESIKINVTGDGWIEMDEETGVMIDGGDVTATWSIKAGGKLSSVKLSCEGEEITIKQTGSFQFQGSDCTLEQSGSAYILTMPGLTKDTQIDLAGESDTQVPGESINVKVQGNSWLEIDAQTGVEINGGDVTANWSIKEGGKLSSVTLICDGEEVTIEGPGGFEFQGHTGRMEQRGNDYTLYLTGLTKDTVIRILGEPVASRSVSV